MLEHEREIRDVRAITRCVAGLAIVAAAILAAGHLVAAPGSDRTIAIYNIHTKETLSVTYKKAGKYDPAALKQINWIMRDWRKNKEKDIDPGLVDLLWEIHAELGSTAPIHLICGYRSRGTNEMLKRSVGGQASESRHIMGKAADVHFPDVPVRRLRYAGLIRERGGVGYYPTSALPFVHLDTDHVRHWPRMPRFELALLFPNGSTRHNPSEGGPITKVDVAIARSSHKELATEVAAFFTVRTHPVAAKRDFAVASSTALVPTPLATPQLLAEPRPVERSSRFGLPASADRQRLAAFEPHSVSEPEGGGSSGYAAAPAYDDEHPDELSYRPFAVAPLLTETASIDDPVLSGMTAPEASRTIDLIDQMGTRLASRLKTGQALAERSWVLEFRGEAVAGDALAFIVPGDAIASLIKREVRTAAGR